MFALLLCVLVCTVIALPNSTAITTPPPIEWAKGYTFGNAESHPHAGVQTLDGGFILVGDGIDCEFRGAISL